MTSSPVLARRLGTADAVAVGLSSMIGAGIFAVFGPASRAAGTGLLVGLAIAAVVAYCNAVASAQLAAAHPRAGGTYVYGRTLIGPWTGFVAGWGFVVGKTASCAAMAATLASYVVPTSVLAQRALAVAVVAAVTAANCRGVTRTARLARISVAISLLALTAVVIGVWTAGTTRPGVLGHGLGAGGVHGTLQAAGLIFFAFAGYARIATLGEEVRDPARTIPRAIPLALGVTLVVYAAVAVTALAAAGPAGLAAATAPLRVAVQTSGLGGLAPVVQVAAAVAAGGALLSLIAGVGRTTLAMAREADLPRALAAVSPVHRVPQRAEVTIGVVVCVLVLVADLRAAIGFSSFGVLVYYAVANACALRQPADQRRWPRGLNVLGLLGCLVLVTSLPAAAIVAGTAVFVVGVAGRAAVLGHRRRAGGRGALDRVGDVGP